MFKNLILWNVFILLFSCTQKAPSLQENKETPKENIVGEIVRSLEASVAAVTAPSGVEVEGVINVDFGTILNTETKSLRATIRNNSNAGENITGVSRVADPTNYFTQTSSNCNNVKPKSTCDIRMSFNGKAAPQNQGGSFSGQWVITFSDNTTKTVQMNIQVNLPAPTTPEEIAAQQAAQLANLTFDPVSVDFGELLETESKTLSIIIRNNNTTPVTFVSSVQQPFTLTTGCSTISAKGTCTARVALSGAGKSGSQSSMFTYGTREVPLSGVVKTAAQVIAETPLVLGISSSVESIDFGTLNPDGISTKTITFRNNSNLPVTLPTVLSSTDYRIISDSCNNKQVAINSSCSVRVSLSGAGKPAGELAPATLSYGNKSIPLSGEIMSAAEVALLEQEQAQLLSNIVLDYQGLQYSSADTLNLGSKSQGVTEQLQFVLRNTGSAPATISSVSFASNINIISSNCSTRLSPNSSCNIRATLNPQSQSPLNLSANLGFEVRQFPITMEFVPSGTILDTTAPDLAITAPTMGSIVREQDLFVSGTCIDAGSGISSVSIDVSGIISNVACIAGLYEVFVDISSLSFGPHWLSVSGSDNAGNESIVGYSFNKEPAQYQIQLSLAGGSRVSWDKDSTIFTPEGITSVYVIPGESVVFSIDTENGFKFNSWGAGTFCDGSTSNTCEVSNVQDNVIISTSVSEKECSDSMRQSELDAMGISTLNTILDQIPTEVNKLSGVFYPNCTLQSGLCLPGNELSSNSLNCHTSCNALDISGAAEVSGNTVEGCNVVSCLPEYVQTGNTCVSSSPQIAQISVTGEGQIVVSQQSNILGTCAQSNCEVEILSGQDVLFESRSSKEFYSSLWEEDCLNEPVSDCSLYVSNNKVVSMIFEEKWNKAQRHFMSSLTTNSASSQRGMSLDPLSGKIIVYGNFLNYRGQSVNRIVRLEKNGVLDTTFNTNVPTGNVTLAKVLSNGKVIATEGFAPYLLNSNGTLDPTFSVTPASSVNDIIEDSGYLLYISNNLIKKVDFTGVADTSFNQGGLTTTGSMSIIKKTADGKYLVSGNFTAYGGTPVNRMMRLHPNGTLDTSFTYSAVNTSATPVMPTNFEIQADGKIVVSASGASSYNGTPVGAIFRLHPNGSLDTSFNNIGFVSNSIIREIKVLSSGKIFVGHNSNTTHTSGTISGGMSMLDSLGNLDLDFKTKHSQSFVTLSQGTTIEESDGNILFLSNLYSQSPVIQQLESGKFRDSLVRMDSLGNIKNGFEKRSGPQFAADTSSASIFDGVVLPDGSSIIIGRFTKYNNTLINKIAKINPDGSVNLEFASNIGSGFGTSSTTLHPNDIHLTSNGHLVIGGSFSSFNGSSFNGLVSLNLDGTVNTTFNQGFTGLNAGAVIRKIKEKNNELIIAGSFTSYNGQNRRNITKLNLDGTLSGNSLSVTTSGGAIEDFGIQSDGKIVIGGSFSISTPAVSRIARVSATGTVDTTFLGTAVGTVTEVEVASDDKIYIAGLLSSINGDSTRKNFAKLLSNGNTDTSFLSGTGTNGSVFGFIRLMDDESVIIGGDFTTYNGTSGANGLIQLNSNGTIKSISKVKYGVATNVFSLDLFTDGKYLIMGSFYLYDGNPADSILKVNSDWTESNI